ncbi:MAG: DUF3048 domain-containing protein [Actinomycetota bacterium]|nr:DUF3048 domain-containing protein [Actinomycetota bacterium]
MTTTAKRGIAIGGGVVVLAVVAFLLMGNREGGPLSAVANLVDPEPAVCPLTGVEPDKEALLARPAVAVKIENNPVAYPLSGLEEAEIVYEELVEGGQTRFMALYHCTDAAKAGPVRSAREVDAAIMTPITRILAAAGGNAAVRSTLSESGIVLVDETDSGEAMQRIPREGISMEHTLYADTVGLRKLGRKEFDEPPPEELFRFGELEGKAKKAKTISIEFGAASSSYQWDGDGWLRFDEGQPLMSETGEQIKVDNVIIEEHTIDYSEITDVTGAASTIIRDVTGTGRAVLFRDGRAIKGSWERETVEGPVRFVTAAGDDMVLAPGTTWIELVPGKDGEAKGSFSYAKS